MRLQQFLEKKIKEQKDHSQRLASRLGFLNPKVIVEREKYEFFQEVLDEFKNQNNERSTN